MCSCRGVPVVTSSPHEREDHHARGWTGVVPVVERFRRGEDSTHRELDGTLEIKMEDPVARQAVFDSNRFRRPEKRRGFAALRVAEGRAVELKLPFRSEHHGAPAHELGAVVRV